VEPELGSLVDLERALAREQRIARAMREVGSALGATLDLDDLLELILGKLTELLDADRATLYLLDDQNGELVSRIVIGEQVRSIRVKVGHGIAGAVAQLGRPLRVADAYEDARFEPEWDALTGYRTRSILAAPLKNHLGKTIGVIQVLNKTTAPEFTTEDEEILAALSTQAAVAIDNSRLFLSLIQKNKQLLDTKEQLEHRVRDLELLFELERATGRATRLEDLVSAALGSAARACEARGGALLLAGEETGDLVEHVVDAADPERVLRIGVKAGEGFLGAILGETGPVFAADLREDARASQRIEGSFPFVASSAIALPLEGEGTQPLGAIGLFAKRGDRPFTGEDASLLRLVSANVSTAVRLFRASRAREISERLGAIGRLLSQVTHDFKTPMTVISGYVQLMVDADSRERRLEFSEQILKQFDVLTAMQREVLEFARGERRIFVRKVYLHKFFGEITRQLGLEMDGRAIELEMDIDTRVVARFDEARIARVVHNLARNAIEAMADRGGRLTIRARLHDGDLLISVSDTGPGIPKEIEGRLFQSFVTSGKKGGTGLGLAIVRKIVEEHAGTIAVRSSPAGCTFEIRLPQGEERPSRPTPSSRRGADGERPEARTVAERAAGKDPG
jgi:signal transduction histidine kinase/putative methionine-R-sulfoxide reductase with GAF domain